MKLILNLFRGNQDIVELVQNHILKKVKKLNEIEDAQKRELKKNRFFLEEFTKMIVFLSNDLEDKQLKIKNLNKSLKASQLLFVKQNEKYEEILSKSNNEKASLKEEKPFIELNKDKIENLKKQIEFLQDKFTALKKVDEIEQIQSLKESKNKLKSALKETRNKNEELANKIKEFESNKLKMVNCFESLKKEFSNFVFTVNEEINKKISKKTKNKKTTEEKQSEKDSIIDSNSVKSGKDLQIFDYQNNFEQNLSKISEKINLLFKVHE